MPHLLVVAALVLAAPAPAAVPGFDVSSVDTSVDPCVDFHQYVCSGWMKKNPIPPDQTRWGRFNVLYEDNLAVLRDILEAAAQAKKRDADTQKIGDSYASCMNERAIEKKGLAPIEPLRKRIGALADKKDLAALLAVLHQNGVGGFFRFGPEPDYKNAGTYIAVVDQSGLGMPDRDYYFREDKKSVELREKYVAHVQKMLALAGAAPEQAAARAKAVLALEARLAKGSLDRVARRDPNNRYHKMPFRDLAALSPAFAWDAYFVGAAPAPRVDSLNVGWPAFVEAMQGVLAESALDDIKSYLDWRLLRDSAPLLPAAFVNEAFDFYDKTLGGAQELKPRWKRCVELTDRAIGEALGRVFVERTFGAAQVWCENMTPEARRLRAQTDPHSPGRYRVNGTVANMPEFRQAFGCKEPTTRQCRVW
jgi:putative endopeptidase